MLKDTKYKYNQYVLKVFGYGENKRIKLIHMNVLRNEGVEDERDKSKVRGVNSEKLEESIGSNKYSHGGMGSFYRRMKKSLPGGIVDSNRGSASKKCGTGHLKISDSKGYHSHTEVFP